MKLMQTMLSALVTVVILNKVAALPQVTTSLPFVPGLDGDDDDLSDFYDSDDERAVSGVIVGTGPAGEPTYVITVYDSDSDDDDSDDDWDDRAVTATYVGDASRATIHVAYSDDDNDSIFSDDDDSIDGDTTDGDSVSGDDTDSDDDGVSGGSRRGRHHEVDCVVENSTAVCTYARVGVVNSETTTSFIATRTRQARPITLIATTGTVPPATSATGTGTGSDASTGTGTAVGSGATDVQDNGAQGNFAPGAVAAGLSAAAAAFMLA